MTDQDPFPSIINQTSINRMLVDLYKEINNELKNYAKKIILSSIGITTDSWGHVTSISDSLKNEVLNTNEVEKLKTHIVEYIKSEVILKLNNEMENKFYSKKAITQIANSTIASLNKQIIEEIHSTIHDELLDSYCKTVEKSVYAIPEIQKIMINKL